MSKKSILTFFVNGKKVVEPDPDPEWTLLFYLRRKLNLCGTKLGCAEGGCGACTVMVSKYNRQQKKIIHLAVNACLAPVCSMHGLAVTTVEGIGSTKTRLHPVQERIAKAHGSQCGFCTPGIVMSMYTLLRSLPKPSYEDLEVAFQGNLCRCTGYRPIIEGYKSFTEEWERNQVAATNGNKVCGLGEKCCKNGGNGYSGADDPQETFNHSQFKPLDPSQEPIFPPELKMSSIYDEQKLLFKEKNQVAATNGNNICGLGEKCCKNGGDGYFTDDDPQQTFDSSQFKPHDPLQEPIFPPELKMSSVYDEQKLFFKGKSVTWHRPTSLEDIVNLKSLHNDAKIVTGNTEIGVEVKFKNCIYSVIIMPNLIKSLKELEVTDSGLRIGAAVTLTDMETSMKQLMKTLPLHKTKIFKAIVEMLYWFAGKQIRNVASVGGNIMTGSPISDLNPIFLAAGIALNLKSNTNERSIIMDKSFFTGYRKNIVLPDEILVSIEVPFTKENQYFKAFKQAKRREDDITIVNMALNVHFELTTGKISHIATAFGGMAPITVLTKNTSKALVGHAWNEAMLQKAYTNLLKDLSLDPSAPGGMIQYRRSLTLSLFFKAYLEITQELSEVLSNVATVNDYDKSGIGGIEHVALKSSQYFSLPSDKQSPIDPIGRPIVHVSGLKQATGEAVYCDDMPLLEGELFLALILSTKAHANIVSIDPTEALQIEGVRAFFSSVDLEGDRNLVGTYIHDEELFRSKTVTSQGQSLGAIVAVDQITAQKAAKRVKVVYEDLKPLIITIHDAIRENSFYPGSLKICTGDVATAFQNADHVIENDFHIGGQEHFYLETQVSRAVPKEDNELELFSSSQHPAEISKLTAHILGVPINRIVTKVKRIGGGFGGKGARALLVALPVALAAFKLQKPVRCMLDRDEDMMMTGGRHPFYFKYKVAFNNDGKIKGLVIHMYSNAGYSEENSPRVMETALLKCDSAYKIPNLEAYGHLCKTHMPSNTAFRGFGGPQAMLAMENIIRDISIVIKRSSPEIAFLNLYKEGDTTHYNQILTNCTIRRCWDECMDKSNYLKRKREVDEYNRKNRWKKRGIAILPTKYGISITVKWLNQAGALVLVYTDGSVLLAYGGTEMGQGLHTKMIQVTSRIFGIDSSKIYISETSTDKVPNTGPTAASTSSDINGMAIMNACNTIVERLAPIKKRNPKGTWEDWIKEAYFECISLSAVGYYYTPGIDYDMTKATGTPFNYFTYGVGCSEVEIDCLTGDHKLRRTDIVMDVGESLNPAIDIGQIEGAFMQGYGLFTLEELIFSPTGTLYNRGPGAYKIPGFADIPAEFNVSLLKGAPNPRAIYSSKGIGEPPLFLASSAFFAIRDAIASARADSKANPQFKLDSPATAARIRMACQDNITAMLDEPEEGSYTPWNIIP